MRWIWRIALGLVAVAGFGFWLAFLSERPPLTTDPMTLAGDGSKIDYCKMPVLDGSGKNAADIPKGNTPGCGYTHFPLPVLADCTEPLAQGADDIRGLWVGVSGKHTGHVERIEQCGSRVVVTTEGLIHDAGPNATAGLTTNDTQGSVLFTIGDKEFCPRTSAGVEWNEGVLDFHVFGFGPVVVRRYIKNEGEGDRLVWEYADGSTTKMKRLCHLPDSEIIPEKRGMRVRLF